MLSNHKVFNFLITNLIICYLITHQVLTCKGNITSMSKLTNTTNNQCILFQFPKSPIGFDHQGSKESKINKLLKKFPD
ncbi:hypothetical protein AAHE18_14G216000 [Arachis hypogaea]